jgi:hypothetical protein
VTSLCLVVDDWAPPAPRWSGRLGPLPGLVYQEIRLPERPSGPVTLRVSLAEPRPLRDVLRAVLPALGPDGRLPSPVTPDRRDAAGPPADGNATASGATSPPVSFA